MPVMLDPSRERRAAGPLTSSVEKRDRHPKRSGLGRSSPKAAGCEPLALSSLGQRPHPRDITGLHQFVSHLDGLAAAEQDAVPRV